MLTPSSSSRSNTSITNLALLGTKQGELRIKDPEPFDGNLTHFKGFAQ